MRNPHDRLPRSALARAFRCLALVLLAVGCQRPLVAAEPYRAFLSGLLNRGYGELAIDYVTLAGRRTDLPADARAELDLDMARSLRAAADEAPSTEIAAQRLVASQAALDKFLREHPKHPDSAAGNALRGELALIRGEQILHAAQAAAGAATTDARFAEARALFEAARPDLAKAVQALAERLVPLAEKERAEAAEKRASQPESSPVIMLNGKKPPRKPTGKAPPQSASSTTPTTEVKLSIPTERMLVEEQWLDASFKAALVDYDLSQTYTDPRAEARVDALQAAAEGFDAIYQLYRSSRRGLLAHLWHGRTEYELGDLETALDIFDEVLGNAPATGERRLSPELAELLCLAESYRLKIMDKRGQQDAAINDGRRWLDQPGIDHNLDGDLAVALQLARLELAKAGSLSGDERSAMLKAAMTRLADVARVPGAHQREAMALRRQHRADGKVADSFKEALAIATAAAASRMWGEAIDDYSRAIQLGLEPRDHAELMSARYELAKSQYLAGRFSDALATADALARDRTRGETAPAAGLLATSAAWSMLNTANAKDRPAAQKRLEQAALLMIENWPQRSETDEARLTLARLKLATDQYPEAVALLEAIRPESERYRAALYLAAQVDWKLYLDQSRNSAAPEKLKAAHDKTVKTLERLIALERKAAAGGVAPSSLLDAELLLAEVHLGSGEPELTMAIVEPLVTAARASRGQPPDEATLGVLALATRAYVAAQQITKARETAEWLLDVGPDQRHVNAAIVDFLRLLKAQSAASAPATSTPTNGRAPAGQPPAIQAILEKLEPRKNLGLGDRIFLGSLFRDMGRRRDAIKLFQAALAEAGGDSNRTSPQTARILTQVRLLLVDQLRQEYRFAEAIEEVDRVVKDNPRAVEPMIIKGEVLLAWAEASPEKLEAAAAQWTRVRAVLQGFVPRPAPYYVAVYNSADCLFRLGQQTKDDAKKSQAEQILKAAFVMNPQLNGAEMVERYKALIGKIEAGRPAHPKPAAPADPK